MIFNLLCRMKQLMFGSKINMGLFFGAFLFAAMTPFFVSNGINDAVPLKVNAAESMTHMEASQHADAEIMEIKKEDSAFPVWAICLMFVLYFFMLGDMYIEMCNGRDTAGGFILKSAASIALMSWLAVGFVTGKIPTIDLLILFS